MFEHWTNDVLEHLEQTKTHMCSWEHLLSNALSNTFNEGVKVLLRWKTCSHNTWYTVIFWVNLYFDNFEVLRTKLKLKMASLTQRLSHCKSCQENVQHREGHCVQCGEPVEAGERTTAPAVTTHSAMTTHSSSNEDDNSMLSSLLSQALARGSAENMELPGMDDESASLLTSEQQERFQMLLPMFQQFLQQGSPFGGDGNPFGGGGGGGGGGGSGGAPPASKAVVESLERLTLDASNLREVTMRSVVRVFKQLPDDERKERKEDESAETSSPPPPLELVCEPASFGNQIHQHELLSHGGVSSSVPIAIRLCLAEPVELNVTPSNSSDMKCVHYFFLFL